MIVINPTMNPPNNANIRSNDRILHIIVQNTHGTKKTTNAAISNAIFLKFHIIISCIFLGS